jgi:putative CocE/NonD family hydrolase
MFGMLFGRLHAERGFQVLVQSCRGTFGSGGSFDPFAEREDGLATLAWMREQPWYPGSFGTTGPSYLGIVQWAIADQTGADHKAMAVQVSSSHGHAFVYSGGSISLATILGWVDLLARQERPFAVIMQQVAAARRLARVFGKLPLADLDRQAVGHRVEYWQDWLTHGDPDDPYWASRRYAEGPAAVSAPVSFVGGWDDILLPALLRDYMALRAAVLARGATPGTPDALARGATPGTPDALARGATPGTPDALARGATPGTPAGREPFLLIGPWQHAEPGNIAATVKDSVAWLRAHLHDDVSQLRPTPVRIYVGGAAQWRDLPSWPPAATEQRWHLRADGGLDQQVPQDSEPDQYTYDPARPTPSVGGPLLARVKGRPDNRALEARPDVLTYTSAPLERDLEVIGYVTADLFVRSSLEHTDFFARLCDVDTSGCSTNICDALIRLTPGQPVPEPDGTIRVRIELWPTAHRFKGGHRLRLQVSSGAHPRFARNTGTGEPPGTATKLLPADQRIYHDPGRPSAVVLPVVG